MATRDLNPYSGPPPCGMKLSSTNNSRDQSPWHIKGGDHDELNNMASSLFGRFRLNKIYQSKMKALY